MRVRLLGLLLVAATGLVIAGCGGSDDSASSRTVTAEGGAPFDRAFIDAMVPHHEAAIAMAKAAKRAGLSQSELLRIADSIAITQRDEIDEMRAWRQQWYGSSAIDPDGGAALGLTEQEMGMQHSGDFSTVQDVDQAFAAAMIEHHQGAVQMAKLALGRAQHSETKELAKSIIDAQQREIDVMEPHAEGMHHAG